MKVELKVTIEFDSWFDNEPESIREWQEFFICYLVPEGSVLGSEADDEDGAEMIAMHSFDLEVIKLSHE